MDRTQTHFSREYFKAFRYGLTVIEPAEMEGDSVLVRQREN